MCLPKKGSCCKLRSEYATEELSTCCCNGDGQTKSHVKKFVIVRRDTDSVKAISPNEVGVTFEESNVLELGEYAEQLQKVFDNISGVRLEPELLQVSRRVGIDFMSQLNLHRKSQRHWATDQGIPVILAKWVPIETVRDRTQTVGPDHARDMCVNGTVRVCDVLALQSADLEALGKWCVGTEDHVHGCFEGTLSGGHDQ